MEGPTATTNLAEIALHVAPNPTSDGVTLTLPETMASSPAQIRIFSADGQLKQTQVTQPGDNQIWLEMNDLPAGYYILNVQTKDKIGSVKIVKY